MAMHSDLEPQKNAAHTSRACIDFRQRSWLKIQADHEKDRKQIDMRAPVSEALVQQENQGFAAEVHDYQQRDQTEQESSGQAEDSSSPRSRGTLIIHK
jgi:hypothetical protein